MKSEKKYYLCTFRRHSSVRGIYFDTRLIDEHPLYYVSRERVVLIDHIEVSEEQYMQYHM